MQFELFLFLFRIETFSKITTPELTLKGEKEFLFIPPSPKKDSILQTPFSVRQTFWEKQARVWFSPDHLCETEFSLVCNGYLSRAKEASSVQKRNKSRNYSNYLRLQWYLNVFLNYYLMAFKLGPNFGARLPAAVFVNFRSGAPACAPQFFQERCSRLRSGFQIFQERPLRLRSGEFQRSGAPPHALRLFLWFFINILAQNCSKIGFIGQNHQGNATRSKKDGKHVSDTLDNTGKIYFLKNLTSCAPAALRLKSERRSGPFLIFGAVLL